MPSFDPVATRADFPILSREVAGKPLVYLDNSATTQKPACVIDTLSRFFSHDNANIHRGVHYLSREATHEYEGAREYLKEQLKVPTSHEMIFVRGATEAINLAAHCLSSRLKEGDEIILTLMEHHANFVPWQIIAEKTGAVLRFASLRDNGELDLAEWKSLFSPRTRLAAFAHISNVLGTVNPVHDMTAYARDRGVLSLVDGAQALPHSDVDVEDVGADFYAFSGHKIFAPDGIGALCAPREFLDEAPPYQTGGDMIVQVSVQGTTFRKSPERFEAGTPNISGAIGLAAAFRYLSKIDRKAAGSYEESLAAHTAEELAKIPGIRIFGTAPGKAAIVSFHYSKAHPHDVGTILDTEGVAIRVGHHCAQPLMEFLGVPATARASFAFYNNHDDVEAFLRAMHKVQRYFG